MSVTKPREEEPCSMTLGGAVNDVFALAIALAIMEEPDQIIVGKDEIEPARDRLASMLYGRAQDLKKTSEGFV